jgi:hypothetical protein
MRRALPLFLLALSFPVLSFALPQGFAPASLWLSTTEATAGENIKVYSVLYNSAADAFEGDIDFEADGESIQTLHFKLGAGETQIFSADWSATAGEHAFSAQLKNVPSGSVGGPAVTNTVTIVVASSSPSVTQTYLNAANDFLASTSPGLASFAADIASTTESWRQAGADWLSKELYTDQSTAASASSTAGTTEDGLVLGTSTYRQSAQVSGGLWGTIKHALLTVLLYICTIQILFYLALLALLFILYKIVRALFTLRRPDGR